jgi:hypothetical protein
MSTNTFLEFNRDLFLCNTIHDPQNLSDIVPVKMRDADGSLFKRTTVTDPHDRVFILPRNLLIDVPSNDPAYVHKYKDGVFKDNDVIYDFTIKVSDVPNDNRISDMNKWMDPMNEITYIDFAKNQNKYISPDYPLDIWIGSGDIDLSYNYFPAPPIETKGGKSNKKTVNKFGFSFNKDPIIANYITNLTKLIEKLQKDIEFKINTLNDKSKLPEHIIAAQKNIQTLRSTLEPYLKRSIFQFSHSSSTTGSEGTEGTTIHQDRARYVYTVKGGSLVKYDPGFVGKCKDYNLKTICPREDDQIRENCEICKNFQYRDWYDHNNPTQINLNARYDDATSEYQHMWLQTWNLGIGIMVLAYGIYYQL